MRVMFCGDVVGRAGRAAVAEHVPVLRKKLALDFVVVNGENAASGFGITEKICNSFVDAGVDAITGGDHVFDQKETQFFIDRFESLLRPVNLPAQLPGVGHRVFTTRNEKKIAIIHLHAQIFMKLDVDCPFAAAEELLKQYILGKNIDAILVDFHAEATAEAMAMGHYLDGRVSAVVGSHTHVPTADCQVLPSGTAYQTDTGMCGDYNSVIGFKKEISVASFLNKIRGEKLVPANEQATLCGVIIETNDKTGLATSIEPVRIGGRLAETLPAA